MEGDLHSDFKENFFAKLADWYRKKLLKVQQGRKTEGREKAIDMHIEEPQEWLFEVARTYRHVRYHLLFDFFLSFPITYVECERTELLRTEIVT